ncbi:MAG TPA: type II toxin-antitoxin system RelE/ParE family toxin [Polyangia bacterium]|jgi:plasmid stabilization system protein ParE
MGEGRRVVAWASSARDSLDEILSFIASDSAETAAKVLEVVLAAAESLSLFSERGRVVPETDISTIREIFVYRYRLLYQVFAAEVRILTVLHGAMDFEGWLQRRG